MLLPAYSLARTLLFVCFQEEVQQLSDTEKLLLYLRLPGETASDSLEDFDQ